MDKRAIIGLVGMGIAASFFGADEASAAVCVLRSSSGTCLMWSGSVSTKLEADDLSGGPTHVYTFDSVITNGGHTASGTYGIGLCTNQGGNQSPGIQVVLITDPTFLTIQNPNVLTPGDAFFSQTAIQSFNNNSGKITQNAQQVPTEFNFVRPDNTISNDLNLAFNKYCPNRNWTFTDGVPCVGRMAVDLNKDGLFSDSATVSCALNQCENLAIDTNPNNFGHFVVQQYGTCQ